jgi:putative ABC transport system permease protein
VRALDRKLLRDVLHLRGQVIAVALVVASGIATLVTMKSAHTSMKRSQADYYREARFAEVFASARRVPRGLVTRIQKIDGVAAVEPRIVQDVTLDVPGLAEPAVGRLVSVPERGRPLLNEVFLRKGRWIEPNHPDEVVVSEAFAVANRLQPGARLGAVINGRWRNLTVTGIGLSPEYVYEINPGAVFPDSRRFGIIWMSHDALEGAFDMRGAFNNVALTLAWGAREADVIDRLDDLLEPWGGAGAYGREEQLSHRFLADEIKGLRVNATIAPSIFLGVAAFLIHLVLTRLVQTQRDQVAVLKAFGYTNAAIGLHYLELAMSAVFLGTLLGVAGGVWLGLQLTTLYKDFFHFPRLTYVLEPSLVAIAVGVSALAAALGALSAVRSAVSLPPAEAMRPEAPPRFHAGWIERSGLRRWLTPASRIVVRNLDRRRGKAVMSILGVAMATAILVVGRYSFDAIDFIMKFQFGTLQREDVTVPFYLARGSTALHSLARLPGVLAVEPFRLVPVRLVHGHREKRLALTGVDPDAELRRMVDAKGRVVPLPADGLVMSSKLAEMLGAKEGDEITVEVLEESRPVVRVRLAGTFDDLVGISAYIDRHALNRLLREGHSVSGAYLQVDPRQAERLYADLKKTPAVAGVTIRAAMLQGFEETIARSMTISNVFMIFFACVIAMGVVYNGARIALSERGHELASLRVLGFTRREVGLMLVGEQAILTAVAVPFGFALGWFFCLLISRAYDTELYRFPVVLTSRTFGFAFLVIAAAAAISSLLVLRRIATLDLVGVLKTRE